VSRKLDTKQFQLPIPNRPSVGTTAIYPNGNIDHPTTECARCILWTSTGLVVLRLEILVVQERRSIITRSDDTSAASTNLLLPMEAGYATMSDFRAILWTCTTYIRRTLGIYNTTMWWGEAVWHTPGERVYKWETSCCVETMIHQHHNITHHSSLFTLRHLPLAVTSSTKSALDSSLSCRPL
jgi:hypothetical protein